jgi:hypothetical protein
MAHDVFVSHSVKDKLVADAVVTRLEAESVRCWVAPRDVVPGADWGESIVDALESSRIMILIFSKNANASPQIKREVERAVDKGVYIIPFRVDDIKPTRSLEYFISTAQWMDAFSPPLERHLDSLAKTVTAILSGSPPPPPPSPLPPSPPPPPVSRPPALRRWMVIAAAAVLIIGAAGWYFAGHRQVVPETQRRADEAQTSTILVPPTPSDADKTQQEALATQHAQEEADADAARKAQIANELELARQTKEEAQRRLAEINARQRGPWLFEDSSSRYLTANELAGLSADDLWRARNEIYARNGYRFSSPKGLAFARSLGSHYNGVDADQDRVFNRMNRYEKANVTLIKSIEDRFK